MKRMACVLALATGTGVVLGATGPSALADNATPALASGLQLAIASPGIVNGESTVNLDATFRGGSIRSVELYVDGALIKKQVIRTRDPHGVISFALDGLAEGDHEILIKAFDTEGRMTTATSRLKVAPEVTDSLARWQHPKKEAMVDGVVPIQIQVDRSVRNPYVTFLIDSDFLAFINLPPFTYNWDTTGLPNGEHTIGVEVYDGETLARVKTLSMKVKVNNKGGLTHLPKETTDPTKAKPGEGVPTPGVVGVAQSVALSSNVAMARKDAKLVRVGNQTLALPRVSTPKAVADSNARQTARNAKPSLPNAANLLPSVKNSVSHVTTPSGTAFAAPPNRQTQVVVHPGLPPAFATLPMTAALGKQAANADFSRIALRPSRAGNIAAMPETQRSKRGVKVVAQAPREARGPNVVTANPRVRTFDVAFNNQRIAFDVAPRVEKGLALAPFRQIFEHTGGKVEWFQKSQTVRAFNPEREIEFRIGQKDAKVNNKSLDLEAKPYLEKGRAIVPLSFVRDAMNVKIHYDAATGRMVIESAK